MAVHPSRPRPCHSSAAAPAHDGCSTLRLLTKTAAQLLLLNCCSSALTSAAALLQPVAATTPPPPTALPMLGPRLRCIVTGGSSGIGEAVCHELGKRRAVVFATGRREDNLQRVVKAVGRHGGRSAFGVGDVAIEADVNRLFSEAV